MLIKHLPFLLIFKYNSANVLMFIKSYNFFKRDNVSWAFSQLRMCSPPPPWVLIRFSWMMRNVLKNRTKNMITNFSNFYFSSYREKFIESWGDDVTNMVITQKIKIGNSIFVSIRLIPDLSCKSEHFRKKNWKKNVLVQHFWEKKIDFFFILCWMLFFQKASRVWEFFLGLVDPSRNRLVSTAYYK